MSSSNKHLKLILIMMVQFPHQAPSHIYVPPIAILTTVTQSHEFLKNLNMRETISYTSVNRLLS